MPTDLAAASFADQIAKIRNEELKQVRKSAVYRALYFTIAMSVPIIIITTTTTSLLHCNVINKPITKAT